jgi:threonine dehydrogenase-like Zn-dependent dehydrogenase
MSVPQFQQRNDVLVIGLGCLGIFALAVLLAFGYVVHDLWSHL